MAATSRPRSHSTRRSPPTSPSTAAIDRSEQRRSVTANVVTGSNRASVLLSERQVNKINKKIANIRHNSIASSSSPQLAAKYLDSADGDALSSPRDPSFRLSQSMTLSPAQEFATHTYPATSSTVSDTSVNSAVHADPVGTFPVRIQEYAIMEDLLFVLMGIDGTYIKIVHPQTNGDDDDYSMDDAETSLADRQTWDLLRHTVDSTLDPSLRHMVEKLLPLSTYYISVENFVEQYSRYEFGSINHALTAAISTILKEYETFIAQLEHQFRSSAGFTLQQFWFYAQDTLQQMKILHELANTVRQLRVANEIRDDDSVDIDAVLEGLKASEEGRQMRISDKEKGGAILNVLTERLVGLGGDPRCKKIYSFLLAKASVPYFEILNAWIYRGEIVDPYNEFMVLERRNVKKENLKEDFNDAYWEMRYTVREKLVPMFLEPLQAKILLAGKYLNVVRECGVNIAKPEEMQDVLLGRPLEERDQQQQQQQQQQQPMTPLGFSLGSNSIVPAKNEVWSAVNGGRFVKSLEIAYKYANQTLLDLLLKEQQLIPRLRSLKHYFFLDQSDFLTSFLDLAKEELKQPAREIPLARLQSLMDLVLRNSSSVAAYDPFKEDLKVAMSPLKLIDELLRIINVAGLDSLPGSTRGDGKWTSAFPESVAMLDKNQSLAGSMMVGSTSSNTSVLSGYDALTLDYTVTFPLSLVISRKALTKYQLLFRHLLYLKHVEDLLCANWMSHKDQLWKRRSSSQDIEAWKFRIFTLRHRMLIFVQQFAYYVTNEVLEPNWRRLESNLQKVSTVDQVLQYHSDFLDTCLKECMLTNAKLLRIYNKLMTSCVVFSTQAERFSQHIKTLEEQNATNVFGIPKGAIGEAAGNVAKAHEAMDRHLSKIEESFSWHMKLLIEALNHFSAIETMQFLCLVVRLDYNHFHKSSSSSSLSRKQ